MTVGDERTRPSHALLNKLVYPADHEFWDENYPPNGHRCRCGVRTLSARQVEKEGLAVQTAMPGPGVYKDPKTGMEYHVGSPGADNGWRNNPGKTWRQDAKAGLPLHKYPDLESAKPLKKAPLTKKKLEGEIAALDAQIKGASDKQALAALEAKKAEYQGILDKRLLAAEKKKLAKEKIALQQELESLKVKTYSGIWQDDVSTTDWLDKSNAIQDKKDYFQSKLDAGGLDAADIEKFKGFLKDLDEFAAEGRHYQEIQNTLKKVETSLAELKKGGIVNIEDDLFSQTRKDAALWADTTKEADKAVRDVCGDAWKSGIMAEREAIYNYTCGSGKFNRPLSGYRKPYSESGSGWEPKYFKGPGKVWIDFEGSGDQIRRMTDMIGRSTYNFDMWLQRGSGAEALEAHLGLARGALARAGQKELNQHVDKYFTNYAFTSAAVNKGAGFSGKVIWNIYAPKGTQMMYAEPFSDFGHGARSPHWDGTSRQKLFGSEAEMIIQRGAKYKITKMENKGGTIFMDVEVHPEKGYELIQQDDDEWKGSRETYT
jgi:hypothetical protein